MKKKIIAMLLIAVMIGIALTNFVKTKIAEEQEVDALANSSLANSGLAVGQMAPDFELETLDGKKVKLSDFQGKKVILNFWATWCPPCKEEIPHMQKYYEKFAKEDNFEIVAVNLTNKDKSIEYVKEFAKTYEITYPVLLDTEGKQMKQYKIRIIPTTFYIDTKGVIQENKPGPVDQDSMKESIKSLD
ncbi:TlpA family protein disulfide reductase [Viridibacillus sp. YIM B01967]|uniref:TlpA family protein disulfide reductase n=1 Tax=Viridibacillus soli TaxID=2798301 RepID=A0ABS1H629_9BACL|nr:TlpA disulfide reductase family protein [Viridibacillus soli]MBK3494867.1 TlpA family protein disulfide reductase [Viridibacillus soli]